MAITDTGLAVGYALGEAASGQAPTSVVDRGPLAYDLTEINYGGSNLNYATSGTNRGLRSTATTGAQRARRAIGNTGDALRTLIDAGKKFTVELVMEYTAAANGARVFGINNRTGGNLRLGVQILNTGVIQFVLNGTSFIYVTTNQQGAGRFVLHYVFDSTHATASNRLRLYLNGTDIGGSGSGIALDMALSIGSDVDLIMFNRESSGNFDRSMNGSLYWGCIYNDALDATRIADHYAVLATDDEDGGGGPTTHDLAAAAIAQASASAALTGGTATSIEVEVTGLDFENAGTSTLEQAFPAGITNMTYVYWEKQAPGYSAQAYFGGHQINRADRTFTGADGIMTVQHNCAGTYNATTGQRDPGVGTTVFDEIATIGVASNGQDRIASHSLYVYSGETQQSFARVDGVWMPRALTVEMVGTLAIVTFYADARDMTSMLKVIRQPWETSGGGVTGVALAMFIGCVPWAAEFYRGKTFGRKTYLRTLTKSEILTKLFTFADDTTDPDVHFSNQFPAITGGTTMADMSGNGNDFTLVDADAPSAFSETVVFTLPVIPTVDLAADATAQATAAAGLLKEVNLAAAAGGQAGASAAMLMGVSLSAAGLAVAGGSASMSHAVPLSASAVAVSVAGAQMSLAVQLTATALATAAASAGMSLEKLLEADGAAQAGASADLSTSSGVDLAASAEASASASAVLSLVVSLSAAAVSQAAASAALAKAVELGADGAAQAGGAASLQVGDGVDLAAAATAQSSAGASLWLDVPLGADALAQALAGGSLSLAVLLGADALASASGSGALAADVQLSAAGQVIATASAALQVTGPISAYLKGFLAHPPERTFTAVPPVRSFTASPPARI